jgi:transcriptional regulator with XRE-family HTH domain
VSNIITGRQLRAARILAGLTQRQLAIAVGVHERSARYWELKGDGAPTSTPSLLEKIEGALLAHGVIVFASPTPGARLATWLVRYCRWEGNSAAAKIRGGNFASPPANNLPGHENNWGTLIYANDTAPPDWPPAALDGENTVLNQDRLSEREFAYCRAYFVGATGAEAARKAGYTSKGARVASTRLLKRHRVRAELARLTARSDAVVNDLLTSSAVQGSETVPPPPKLLEGELIDPVNGEAVAVFSRAWVVVRHMLSVQIAMGEVEVAEYR